MDWLGVLSLILFAALAVAFLAFLRRATALVAAIREHERFQAEVAAIEQRTAESLDPLISRIEDVRHHRVTPDRLVAMLPEATTAAADLVRDARSLRPPRVFRGITSPLAEDFARSERAIGLIEHGANALVNSRGGPRELEAQTSLKRGALALRNARADIAAITRRVADAPAPPARARTGVGASTRPTGGRTAPVRTAPATLSVPPPAGPIGSREGPSDPSM